MEIKQINFKSCCSFHPQELPEAAETVARGGFVNWGEKNDFCNTLYDCYLDCSILGSCINALTDYVSGSGVSEDKIINRSGELLSELLQRVVFDYLLLGNATVQVIKNKKGEVAELSYVDVRNCRLSEDGDFVYYSKKWGAYTKQMKKFDRWKKDSDAGNSILWMKSPKTKNVYGSPIWGSALREVLTYIEASKINYSTTLNHFAPTTLISFNNGTPPDEVMDDIEQAIINKYTGADGTNIMLTWSDSKDNAPEILSFDTTNYSEKYITIENACRKAILSTFRCSGQLVGLIEGQTSFNSVEFLGSFSLWKTTVARPIQTEIEKMFQKMGIEFRMNEFIVDFGEEEEV